MSTANMKVRVWTMGTSDWPMDTIRSWPNPLIRNICSVMMAPAKMPGTWSAMRVTTGIMLFRITWVMTTLFSRRPLERAVRT